MPWWRASSLFPLPLCSQSLKFLPKFWAATKTHPFLWLSSTPMSFQLDPETPLPFHTWLLYYDYRIWNQPCLSSALALLYHLLSLSLSEACVPSHSPAGVEMLAMCWVPCWVLGFYTNKVSCFSKARWFFPFLGALMFSCMKWLFFLSEV